LEGINSGFSKKGGREEKKAIYLSLAMACIMKEESDDVL